MSSRLQIAQVFYAWYYPYALVLLEYQGRIYDSVKVFQEDKIFFFKTKQNDILRVQATRTAGAHSPLLPNLSLYTELITKNQEVFKSNEKK